jgi:glutathione S-transferase
MTLQLYYHPLASFCHKVLVALYEAGTEFKPQIVDLMDPGEHARFLDLWPVGKMPVLHDSARGETIPETSIINEYLDRTYSGPASLLPGDFADCLQSRLWDRFFDLYVQGPMQTIVGDRISSEERRDPARVAGAEKSLITAYDMVEKRLNGRNWIVGEAFTIADCAAAPALFYAGILVPFPERHCALRDYFERLLARPSFRRVLIEARPYFDMFPFRDKMPRRFLELSDA